MLQPYDEFVTDQTNTYKACPDRADINLPELTYSSLGLAGESGELSDHVKKYWRGDDFNPYEIALELGDTLYYATRIAHCLGFTLGEVTDMNQIKLNYRYANGKDTKAELQAVKDAYAPLRL